MQIKFITASQLQYTIDIGDISNKCVYRKKKKDCFTQVLEIKFFRVFLKSLMSNYIIHRGTILGKRGLYHKIQNF